MSWETIDKDLLIEALLIAIDNFNYDAEYDKAEQVGQYVASML